MNHREQPVPPLKLSKVLGLVLGAVGVGLILFTFAPDRYAFYPRCMLNAVTGLQCPGCGGLRATHQLLHGNVAAAFRLNPMVFMLLPLLGLLYGSYLVRVVTGHSGLNLFRYPVLFWLLLGVMVLFGVVRNLPVNPFAAH